MTFDFDVPLLAETDGHESLVPFALVLQVRNLERLALDTILEEVLITHLDITLPPVE